MPLTPAEVGDPHELKASYWYTVGPYHKPATSENQVLWKHSGTGVVVQSFLHKKGTFQNKARESTPHTVVLNLGC